MKSITLIKNILEMTGVKLKKIMFKSIVICIFLVGFKFELYSQLNSDNQLINLPPTTEARFQLPTDKVWPENIGDANVCLWSEDKIAAATLTIDDNIEYEHSWWLHQQNEIEGLKFTWFVIKNSVTSWDKYQVLIDAGNEIQGHDVCSINDLDEDGYRNALNEIKTAVNDNLVYQSCLTYAYPCGYSDKVDVAKEIYISMRGVVGVLNNANKVDYLNVNSRSAVNDVHDVQVLLNPSEKLYNKSYYRGWLSYHYHGLNNDDKKQQTIVFLEALSAEKDNIWIGTYSEVARYGQERDTHSITVDKVNSEEIKFTLTDKMHNDYFDFPLTVKVCIDSSWTQVTAIQNGQILDDSIITYNNKKYALINAVPDRGQVTILDGDHNVYYCKPDSGLLSNEGTKVAPWPSLEEVMDADINFEEGDIIYLMSGNHGFPVINQVNSGDVTITRAEGESPIIQRIKFSGASHWLIKNIDISTKGLEVVQEPVLTHPVYPKIDNSLVQIRDASSYITLDSCNVYSIDNSENWTQDDWNYKAWNGIYHTHTDHVTIKNCHIKNVNFGIHNTNGNPDVSNTLFEYNVVENFAGDGLRGHGVNTVIQYNTVKNVYNVNGNHDDMIQVVGSSTGLVLRGNKFINYTDPNQPFKGSGQGIAIFDGVHYNYVIENNLVVVDHWHGISVYGAIGCKIVNNTAIDINGTSPGPAWIQIKHQGSTLSNNNIINNNICNTLDLVDNGVGEVSNNITISFSQYDQYFSDADNFDFSLKSGSPAIDAGTDTDAPQFDINQNQRPQGEGVDLGAYEYNEISSFSEEIQNRDEAEFSISKHQNGLMISNLNFENDITVKVFDIQGRLAYNQPGIKTNEYLVNQVFNRGIYLVHISDKNDRVVKKIVID